MGIVMLFGIVGRWPIGSSVCVESEIYSGLHMGMLIIWCMSVSSRQLITQHCLIYCQYPTWLTVCGWVGWGAQGKNITVPECPGQVNLFTTTARPSGCVIFTTIARYSGLIHTPRWPAVAGAATTWLLLFLSGTMCYCYESQCTESSGTCCRLQMEENCSVCWSFGRNFIAQKD